MADWKQRIRTVRPELWTSHRFMECTYPARLLYIGMMNFCDDVGRHRALPKALKSEVFPGDDVTGDDVAEWLDELVKTGLITLYASSGEAYLEVNRWSDKQVINKPQKARYPDPLRATKFNCLSQCYEFLSQSNDASLNEKNTEKSDSNEKIREPSGIDKVLRPEPSAQERRGEERRGKERKGKIVDSTDQPAVKKDRVKVRDQGSGNLAKNARQPGPKREAKSGPVWEAYSQAYEGRYNVLPRRSARINSALCRLVDEIGRDDAPAIAAFYLSHNNAFYVTRGHPVDLLANDAQKLRAEWVNGATMTGERARQIERTATNYENAAEALRRRKARQQQHEGVTYEH